MGLQRSFQSGASRGRKACRWTTPPSSSSSRTRPIRAPCSCRRIIFPRGIRGKGIRASCPCTWWRVCSTPDCHPVKGGKLQCGGRRLLQLRFIDRPEPAHIFPFALPGIAVPFLAVLRGAPAHRTARAYQRGRSAFSQKITCGCCGRKLECDYWKMGPKGQKEKYKVWVCRGCSFRRLLDDEFRKAAAEVLGREDYEPRFVKEISSPLFLFLVCPSEMKFFCRSMEPV